MKTPSNINTVQENNTMKLSRHRRSNKSKFVTKTESFRSSRNAQMRALQLRDNKAGTVIILQKLIEVFYVKYQTAK